MNDETYHSRMERKLIAAFAPTTLEINDDSARHAGHSGHDPRGETHFNLLIVSDAFKGMSSVARHREIYRVLADEMKERVHALSVRALTMSENTHI